MDGFIPYSRIPHNGSLYFSFGFSVQAMECNLTRFWKAVTAGFNPKDVEYIPCLAEKEIVEKYSKE
jgi:hypothetical protein